MQVPFQTSISAGSTDVVPHRIVPWMLVPLGEENIDISDSTVVHSIGVPKKVITRFLKKEIKQRDEFLSLPFALAFVLVFSMCFLNHDEAILVGDVEDAISVELHENAVFGYTDPGWMGHKDMEDVHSISDVWSWLRVGLCPLLFRHFQSWSELSKNAAKWPTTTIPDEARRVYLKYNRLVGGLEITQLRGEVKACPNQKVSDIFSLECIPPEEVYELNLHLEPEPVDIQMEKFKVDQYLTKFFLAGSNPQEVDMRLRQLELSSWITNATVKMSAHFMSYNAHFDTLTLTSAMFLFSRSGRLWKEIVHSTFVMHQYRDTGQVVWDALFATMLLYLVFNESKEIWLVVKGSKGRTFKQNMMKYWDVWNLIDWISIGAGALLIGLFIVHNMNLQALKKELENVANVERNMSSNLFEERLFEAEMTSMYGMFRSAQHFSEILRSLACAFPLVLVMRLFKSFNAQPRLALVTNTMVRASNDLLHFGLVFLATFVSFSMMANALFAHEIPKFRTFGRSFTTCFEVLMGEFDWASDMKAAGRTLSYIWFISFQILMALIMVNMLLAIVIDTYTDVKSKLHDDSSLQKQLCQIWKDWMRIRAGEILSYKMIYSSMKEGMTHQNSKDSIKSPEHDNTLMQIDDVLSIVPEIKIEQASHIMIGAVRWYRHQHESPMGLADAMRAIGVIQVQVGRMSESASEQQQLNRAGSFADKPSSLEAIHKSSQRSQSSAPRSEATNSLDDLGKLLERRMDQLDKSVGAVEERLEAKINMQQAQIDKVLTILCDSHVRKNTTLV